MTIKPFGPGVDVGSGDPLPQLGAGQSLWSGVVGMLILLLVAVIGLQPFDVPSTVQSLTGEGDMLRQLAYVGSLCLIMMSARLGSDRRPVLPLLMLALLFWCALSVLWSIEPLIALRRLTLTVIIVVSVFMGTARIGVPRTITLLNYILPLLLIINYITVLILPIGVHGIEEVDQFLVGNWRGITDHKNYAGPLCAVTILSLIFLPQKNLYLRSILIAATAYFLFKTQSKTSIALLAPAILFGAAVYLTSARTKIFSLLILPLLIGILLILEDFSALASNVTSNPDLLTGRPVIWAALLEYASQNLLGGAGFGSFWNVGAASPMLELTSQEWVAGISSGHSGYLDFLVQTGLPGLILAILAIMVVPLWQIAFDARIPRHIAAFSGAVLVFFFGHNFTESSLMDRDSQMWVFALLALALVHASRASVIEPR